MERLADRVILLFGWRRAVVAFLAGALASLSQPPFDFLAVCFISFPVLVWLVDGAVGPAGAGPLRRLLPAAWVGWCFGFGYFVAGLWWIGNALLVDADNFAWAIPFAVLGLPALLAVFYAIATALARLFWSDGLGRIFALAVGFGVAEWLRAFVLTGFPWNAIGYSAMPVPLLMQSAAVVGLYGMNVLAVFVFAAPALLASRLHRKTGIAIALLLAALHVGFGFYRLENAVVISDGPNIRIVQPSIKQTMKWDKDSRRDIFETLIRLTEAPPADGKSPPEFIIWPETSVPYILTETPDALQRLADVLQPGQVLLAGAVRSEPGAGGEEPRYYNAITMINDAGEIIGAADKLHLVPFGEYLPLASLLGSMGISEVVDTPGGFSAASHRRSLALSDTFSVLPLVCYEAIFPAELGYDGPPVSAMVNVTNDAWYGNTPGPYQHFRQAQLRAVEQGLPLVRAANNGLSAVVDPYGQVMDGLALDAVGTVDIVMPQKISPVWENGVKPVHGLVVLLIMFIVSALLKVSMRNRIK